MKNPVLEFYAANAILVWVLVLAWYVLQVLGLYKMFEKAGESGWKAIIPFYNLYILFKICWQTNMFWVYLVLQLAGAALTIFASNMMMLYISYALSLVSGILVAVLCYNVSLAYGHGFGYFLGLYILSGIFVIILGFGSSKYQGNRYMAAME